MLKYLLGPFTSASRTCHFIRVPTLFNAYCKQTLKRIWSMQVFNLHLIKLALLFIYVLMQLQTSCCGEMRRKHSSLFFSSTCYITGSSSLETHLLHLQPNFCFYLLLLSMDTLLCRQRCKYWFQKALPL